MLTSGRLEQIENGMHALEDPVTGSAMPGTYLNYRLYDLAPGAGGTKPGC